MLFVQHYGLTRARLPSGRYEPVRVAHSWNANWMATSAVTFRLQRHADHHIVSSKPYQVCESISGLVPVSHDLLLNISP